MWSPIRTGIYPDYYHNRLADLVVALMLLFYPSFSVMTCLGLAERCSYEHRSPRFGGVICTVRTVSYRGSFCLFILTSFVHTVRMVVLCLSCCTYGCFLWVV